MSRLSNGLVFKIASFFLVIIFTIAQYGFSTLALSGPQSTVFQDHINYFNVNDCSSGSTTTSSTGTTQINPCCTSGSTTLVGSNNAEMTWNYFIGQGLSNTSVAGIMGNLTIESGFVTTVENGGQLANDPSTVGIAWGLPQWDPGSKVPGIQQQSGVSGNIDDLSTQLQIIWWELSTNNSPSAGWNYQTYKSINNVMQATQYWQNHFEGLTGPVEQSRLNAANNWIKTAQGQGTVTPSTSSVPSTTPNSCSSASTSSSSSQYENPLKNVQQLTPERIDQGVDYGGQGTVDAIGDGQIIGSSLTNSGWDYGGYDAFIVEHLSDGSASGKNVYVAEDCVPVSGLHTGETVTAGQPLCNITNPSSSGIETGWANSAGTLPESQMAEAGSINGGSTCIENSVPTLIGLNYNQLLVSLGANSGLHKTPGTCGSLPSGWPTWN